MDSNCIFCDKSKIQERIVFEDDFFYIIATLGQITDGGYLLLIPKQHVPCIGAMEQSYLEKVDEMSRKIIDALVKEYRTHFVTIFEHGIVGQTVNHAHVHFLPTYGVCFHERVMRAFPKSPVYTIANFSEAGNLYSGLQEPYLLVGENEEAGSSRFLDLATCWNPLNVPSQYLRTVIAEELGRPERANWRNMDPELDKKLWSETVLRMKKYF